MSVSLVPDRINLTAGSGVGNTFQILQNSSDANVVVTAASGAFVNFDPELKCSSSSGIVASAGDVQSFDAGNSTVNSLNTLARSVNGQAAQIANLISVINTAFGLSLS